MAFVLAGISNEIAIYYITELQQNVSSSTTVSKYGRARKCKGIYNCAAGLGKALFH